MVLTYLSSLCLIQYMIITLKQDFEWVFRGISYGYWYWWFYNIKQLIISLNLGILSIIAYKL